MSVRLKPTHDGNVYELLADFLLSLLGISNPQRRQFDEGYDFYCSLSTEEKNILTFDSPFTIQIKSGSEFKIKYGKASDKWKKEDILWLFNHSTPFFVGFIDVNTKCLQIYDTTGLWYLYGKGEINCSQVVFKPSSIQTGVMRKLPKVSALKNWQLNKGDGKKYEIDLGNPLVTLSIADVGDEVSLKLKRKILNHIILLERQNIINRNLGIYCFKEIKQNTTNQYNNIQWGLQILDNYNQEYISKIYDSITFALISLSSNLRSQGRDSEVNAIKKLLTYIPQQDYFNQLYNQDHILFDWANPTSS